MTNSKLYPIFILALALFVSACGGGGSDNGQTTESDQMQANESTTQSSDDVRTIDIMGIDQMKFVVKEEGEMIGTGETVQTNSGDSYYLLESIDAQPGQELRIRLTTISQLPAQAMSHNYVQFKQDADVQSFVNAAIQAKENNYIPADMTDMVIAHTDMAAGGETVEVTFTVPEESGEYPFVCSFPAHFSAGMKGVLNVQ